MWKIKPPLEYAKEVRYRPILEGAPKDEFPDLNQNKTTMARVLTLDMYKWQYDRATESGVIFDDVIRPGLEDPGQSSGPLSVGCVAGDAQSYILFCHFFDKIIEAYHGYKMTGQESDFNIDNLKGGDDFEAEYAVGCEIRANRCVEGFSFPTHCCRGERRRLHTLAKKAFGQMAEELPGKLYSLGDLEQGMLGDGFAMETATDLRMKTGVARDWPESRAAWLNEEGNVVVWINIEDHLQLITVRTDPNIKEAFNCIGAHLQKLEALYRKLRHSFVWKQQLGWVVSSPAEVGTGLRASVHLKLMHLPLHKWLGSILERLRLLMEPTGTAGSSGVFKVSNAHTIGFTEVELVQMLVDGVKLLIRMEKALEDPEGSIHHLVPAQK